MLIVALIPRGDPQEIKQKDALLRDPKSEEYFAILKNARHLVITPAEAHLLSSG